MTGPRTATRPDIRVGGTWSIQDGTKTITFHHCIRCGITHRVKSARRGTESCRDCAPIVRRWAGGAA